MGSDLLTLFQRFELLTFFSGYPFLYTLVSILVASWLRASGGGKVKLPMLLPIAYAIVGTLFLWFLIRQANRPVSVAIVVLRCWGVLAILFWIPRLRKWPVLSLLHSLVFFGLAAKDMIGGLSTPAGRDLIHNDMTIFSLSFLLNATIFLLVFLVVFVRGRARRRPGI